MPRHSSSAPIIGLLLQWVPGGPLCERKQRVVRIVYGDRIGTSPFRKSGLFNAPSMQKSRESVVAFNAAWFGINPVLLVALLAELLVDGPRSGPHRRILERDLVGERRRPGARPALDEVQVLPRPEGIGVAVYAHRVVMGNRFGSSRRRRRFVMAPHAGRQLIFAGIGRLQQGETERSIRGRRLLSLCGERRKPAIGRIDDLRSARPRPLGRTERRPIIGRIDLAFSREAGESRRPSLVQFSALRLGEKLLVRQLRRA